MFQRSGTNSKFEITAPPNDLANKLKLQHPPPALLLSEQQHHPSAQSSKTKATKKTVLRNKSLPLIDSEDRFNASLGVNRSSNNSYEPSDKRSKKKNMFSFLKKKQDKNESDMPPQRMMSRTPENFGRKYIDYDHPGSVPPLRRPHSSASDRHNGIAPNTRSTRGKKYAESEDEDVDEPRTGYPRFKPVRVAPPIPTQASNMQDGGYDSLEKFRNLKPQPQVPQSDDGSVVSSSAHSASLLSYMGTENNVPGLVGIKNHGNTCFMNAIIQCLSNTESLLHYLLTSSYKKDLVASVKKRQKSRSASFPVLQNEMPSSAGEMLAPNSEGAITECVGLLIKSLWNAQYEPKVSAFVRDVIALWGQQYRGCSQHDAQEFLLWLLDHLHEDLNQATGERVTMVSTSRL